MACVRSVQCTASIGCGHIFVPRIVIQMKNLIILFAVFFIGFTTQVKCTPTNVPTIEKEETAEQTVIGNVTEIKNGESYNIIADVSKSAMNQIPENIKINISDNENFNITENTKIDASENAIMTLAKKIMMSLADTFISSTHEIELRNKIENENGNATVEIEDVIENALIEAENITMSTMNKMSNTTAKIEGGIGNALIKVENIKMNTMNEMGNTTEKIEDDIRNALTKDENMKTMNEMGNTTEKIEDGIGNSLTKDENMKTMNEMGNTTAKIEDGTGNSLSEAKDITLNAKYENMCRKLNITNENKNEQGKFGNDSAIGPIYDFESDVHLSAAAKACKRTGSRLKGQRVVINHRVSSAALLAIVARIEQIRDSENKPIRNISLRAKRPVCPSFIPRHLWTFLGRYSKFVTRDISLVAIHHEPGFGSCINTVSCIAKMRDLQDRDVNENGFENIRYNFCFGGDHSLYEGLGYHRVGNHTKGINHLSLGICFIGDFSRRPFLTQWRNAVQHFLKCSVDIGALAKDYKIISHPNIEFYKCPGSNLYNEIKTWPQFLEIPLRPNSTVVLNESQKAAIRIISKSHDEWDVPAN